MHQPALSRVTSTIGTKRGAACSGTSSPTVASCAYAGRGTAGQNARPTLVRGSRETPSGYSSRRRLPPASP
jgi:hypothetical protein